MAETAINLTPLGPGQRVAVFPFPEASGATLGYYGTVTSVFYHTVRTHPNSPDDWRYRVHVPALGGIVEFAGRDMVRMGWTEGNLTSAALLELQFDAPDCGDDSFELRGAFRPPGGSWGRFHFRKSDKPYASFQLCAPVSGVHVGEGKLRYEVPVHVRLNRRYVLDTLAEILGMRPPTYP